MRKLNKEKFRIVAENADILSEVRRELPDNSIEIVQVNSSFDQDKLLIDQSPVVLLVDTKENGILGMMVDALRHADFDLHVFHKRGVKAAHSLTNHAISYSTSDDLIKHLNALIGEKRTPPVPFIFLALFLIIASISVISYQHYQTSDQESTEKILPLDVEKQVDSVPKKSQPCYFDQCESVEKPEDEARPIESGIGTKGKDWQSKLMNSPNYNGDIDVTFTCKTTNTHPGNSVRILAKLNGKTLIDQTFDKAEAEYTQTITNVGMSDWVFLQCNNSRSDAYQALIYVRQHK